MIKHMIFYVTLDPERALGLEDVLPNYTIICPYKSQLTEKLKRLPYNHDREQKVRTVVLEEHMTETDVEKIVERGTYGILQSAFVRKYMNTNVGCRTPHIMVLKNSQLIEDFCKKHSWKLLAPKAKIAERFENKISQYKLLKNVVSYPPSSIGGLGDYYSGHTRPPSEGTRSVLGSPYQSLRDGTGQALYNARLPRREIAGLSFGARLRMFPNNNPPGPPLFVLQFNRGHSGNSTFFIKSPKDLEKLAKKFPKREVKISEYIEGKTYTLNCLALKSGAVITGSISEQITGLKSATNNPNTTCGNDFISPQKLSRGQTKKIEEIAQNVGTALREKGYMGLFGIDVIISERGTDAKRKRGPSAETTSIYFIEVNTHQPASVSFEAKLHRKIGKTPLLAYFILDVLANGCRKSDFLHRHVGSPTSYMGLRKNELPPIILPISAKQIIYRNKTTKTLNREYIEKKYKDKGLISRMKRIKPNEEIYRRQQIREA